MDGSADVLIAQIHVGQGFYSCRGIVTARAEPLPYECGLIFVQDFTDSDKAIKRYRF